MKIICGEYKRQEINYIKDGKGKTKRFETQYRIVGFISNDDHRGVL